MWPRLESSLKELENQVVAEPAFRKDRALLEEMLELLRSVGTASRSNDKIYTAENIRILMEAMPILQRIGGSPNSVTFGESGKILDVNVYVSEPDASTEQRRELLSIERNLAMEGIRLAIKWSPF
jgi:hypothetical protein